jgi:predicted O-methyltransferase YrrM
MSIAENVIGSVDAIRLKRSEPDLAPRHWQPETSGLAEPYGRYVHEVSSPDHAASLEVCVYLDMVCRARQAKRMLDTGSGFSSYVLRRYAATQSGAAVVSADHSQDWLGKTKDFLAANDLSVDGLIAWEAIERQPRSTFDVIFHDVAGGRIRETGMPIVARLLRPGGCVVFDDAHHQGHRAQMYRTAHEFALRTFSLRRWVLDRYGRYAVVAT